MNSGEFLAEGLRLMLLGMGAVFVFLTLLVLVIMMMSSLLRKFAPVPAMDSQEPLPPAPLDEETLLVIVSAAVHSHRLKQGRL